jgi:aspartyl-tRNA(Asn)/glutamyl-tRNA(Gln) amidotransferase subunit A
MAGAECQRVLERDLPGRRELLHPLVGNRLARTPTVDSPDYAAVVRERERMERGAASLFDGVDLLALPGALLTPPPVRDVERMERYVEVNTALLRPTCPIGMLGLCAVTLPVGLDDQGMPVGLQLVGPGGRDPELLGLALAAERTLGTAEGRLGEVPRGGRRDRR